MTDYTIYTLFFHSLYLGTSDRDEQCPWSAVRNLFFFTLLYLFNRLVQGFEILDLRGRYSSNLARRFKCILSLEQRVA